MSLDRTARFAYNKGKGVHLWDGNCIAVSVDEKSARWEADVLHQAFLGLFEGKLSDTTLYAVVDDEGSNVVHALCWSREAAEALAELICGVVDEIDVWSLLDVQAEVARQRERKDGLVAFKMQERSRWWGVPERD